MTHELWETWSAVRDRSRFVDLTHAFGPGIPHAAMFSDERRSLARDHAADGFQAHVFEHVGQWGTHVDPPVHFHPGGRTLDEIPVADMVLPLVVLDVSAAVAADADYCVAGADVAGWEARNGAVPPGSFVALRTDWSHRWPDAGAMRNDGHTPGWSVEVLQFLCETRDIAACGHETSDTDSTVSGAANGYPCETYILGQDRYQIELLTGLDQVPEAGALIVASFPKPFQGSGFPARAFAIVPED